MITAVVVAPGGSTGHVQWGPSQGRQGVVDLCGVNTATQCNKYAQRCSMHVPAPRVNQDVSGAHPGLVGKWQSPDPRMFADVVASRWYSLSSGAQGPTDQAACAAFATVSWCGCHGLYGAESSTAVPGPHAVWAYHLPNAVAHVLCCL